MAEILGIHHVTAITGDAQRNLDFYAGLLGLRLVKRTVNFDDPTTYHFYYGDEVGSPGSILTFFPIASAPAGRRGPGQATATAFEVPVGALGYWKERLSNAGVPVSEGSRFGEPFLSFHDPDGMVLELVPTPGHKTTNVWEGSAVPAEFAIRQVHSFTLTVANTQPTAELLTNAMGFRQVAQAGGRTRYEVGAGGSGATVDLVEATGGARGHVAVGSVHHVAWRTADDAGQQDWLTRLSALGFNVTPVQDRNYFRSIYFREPGGVLFEIATDAPGFAIDEPVETLGESIKLPQWLERVRPQIEAALPKVTIPRQEA